MFARKFVGLIAFAIGLTSFGILLAEDPKPSSDPLAAKASSPQSSQGQAPANPLPSSKEQSQNKSPEKVKQAIDQLSAELKPGEQKILINAMFCNLRGGCFEECGLFPDKPSGAPSVMATTLSKREMSVLMALFRAMKATGEIDVPVGTRTITMEIGKTGPVLEGEMINWNTIAVSQESYGKEPKIKKISSGSTSNFSLKIVPTIDKDTGLIQMEIQVSTVRPDGPTGVDKLLAIPGLQLDSFHLPSSAVPSARTVPGPQFDTHHLAPVAVPSAGTVVVGGTIESLQDKTKKTEWLWVLDAHIVPGKN